MEAQAEQGVVTADLKNRIESLDWTGIAAGLDERGYATTTPILTPEECAALVRLYGDEARFRSRVDLARYRFGVGDYKYFAAPLPPLVQALRAEVYPRLAPIANAWLGALRSRGRFPPDLGRFLAACRRRGQTKPTPLLLHYEAGGYNCLHQDLYGDLAFPLQMTVLLSRRGADFTGGEFLLVEQRPRAQSRGEAIGLDRGETVIFTTSERPVRGARGYYRAAMRHGVSRLLTGSRYTLGVIFHDAK
jgi:hypothetical protein